MTSSSNPWSQVYKLATGKARTNSIMTTVRKPDGTETSSILETMNLILYHLITKDREKDTYYQKKKIRKMIEEPNKTSDNAEFTQGEIKQTIEIFNGKKSPGIDGITSGIFLRTFNKFSKLITAIYNQCLKRGCFPRKWKTAKIIPITKPGKENSMDSSKFHPIILMNIGGYVLEKLLINEALRVITRLTAINIRIEETENFKRVWKPDRSGNGSKTSSELCQNYRRTRRQ